MSEFTGRSFIWSDFQDAYFMDASFPVAYGDMGGLLEAANDFCSEYCEERNIQQVAGYFELLDSDGNLLETLHLDYSIGML